MFVKNKSIHIIKARTQDIPSLTTILPRALFPVNDHVKQALPDTSLMRGWWTRVFEEEIVNPTCHVLIALDATSQTVIGVMCLRQMNAGTSCGGFWAKHEWTDDHDRSRWSPSINCMIEYGSRMMGMKDHYLLEFLAVDHEYKGYGIGAKLVEQACDLADEAELPIFLQSGAASQFYTKLGLGFEIEAQVTYEGYNACLLVRPPGKRNG